MMVSIFLKILTIVVSSLSWAETTDTDPPTPVPIETPEVVEQEPSCRSLEVGQSLTVDENSAQSPTGLERRFQLTRDSDSSYTVTVNLNFRPTNNRLEERYGGLPIPPSDLEGVRPGKPNPTHSDELVAAMMARTRECFQRTHNRLVSTDGTTINFALANSTQSETVPQSNVQLEQREFRSHSRAWSAAIDCPTITHEVLHLLGLVDGYHEQDQYTGENLNPENEASQTLYDCRAIEPQNSVMRNQSIGGLEQLYESVRCPYTGELTRRTRVETLPQRCPDGSVPGKRTENIPIRGLNDLSMPGFQFFYTRSPLEATLRPAHVRFITQPHCNQVNQRYIQCSQNAYRTRSNQGCLPTNNQCDNGEHLN